MRIIDECFDEAKKRFHLNDHGKHSKPLAVTTGWCGLGFPYEYKDAIKAGYFKPHSTESFRCLCWYVLTDKGREEYKRRFQEEPWLNS